MTTNPPPSRLDRIEATLELLAERQIQFQEQMVQRQTQFQEEMEQRQIQFQEEMNQFREEIEQRQTRFQEQLEQTQAQLDRQIPVIADLRVTAEALLQTAEQDRDDILLLAAFLRRHTSDGHGGQ